MEIVRFAYEEGHARRTVDAPGFEERIAPEYRFHGRPGFPGQTVYRLEEMPALWADLDATFVDHSLVPTRYEDLEPYVLVTLRQTARLRGSDQRISETIYMLWFLSGGRIQETWTFTDKAAAIEAAKSAPDSR